jgi:hypothetical protein
MSATPLGKNTPGDDAAICWAVNRYPGGEMKKLCLLIALIFLPIFSSCNFPGNKSSNTPTQALGSIKGILWHDLCKFSGGESGEPFVLGQGCIQWGVAVEEFGPNQLKDSFESGWVGVTLHLGSGSCPSVGLATAITNDSGEYQFDGLSAGTYCVSYNNLIDGNNTILIPGEPTFPSRGDDGFYATINLPPAVEKIVNFGYAWQFYN